MWASINDSMLSSVHLFQSLRLCYSRRVRELLAVEPEPSGIRLTLFSTRNVPGPLSAPCGCHCAQSRAHSV